jgi:hypothetical protein
MAVNDARVAEDCLGADSLDPPGLDAKTHGAGTLAALVAVGGAVPSYGAQADAAVKCGRDGRRDCRRAGWRGSHRRAALRCRGGPEAGAGAGV